MLNQPLTRLVNMCTDPSPKSARWVPSLQPDFSFGAFLQVPADPLALSKKDDRNWRKNWKWVLLASTGNLNCWPFYMADNKKAWWGMKTLFPLRTRLFAMRLGPKPIRLVTIDRYDAVHKPTFFNPEKNNDKVYVVSYEDMSRWNNQHPITFI